MKTYEEVVDEIYNHVDNVEPWMTGNMRGPSTAFCLLYKLSTFNLDGRQVTELIEHVDSVYIRAVSRTFLCKAVGAYRSAILPPSYCSTLSREIINPS